MAPRKSHKKDHKAMVPDKSTMSAGAGVAKHRYKRKRFHEDGLLNVERKAGKYFKIAQQNQQQSPLLRLPAELRNKIFAFALGGKTFEIQSEPPMYKNVIKFKHALALLQVCRQIYAETTLLPFSTNTFSIPYPYMLGRWAESLHPARAQSITWVQVNFHPKSFLYTTELFRFHGLLLYSKMNTRGYVILASDVLKGHCPVGREQRRKQIEEALQAENEDIKFIWE